MQNKETNITTNDNNTLKNNISCGMSEELAQALRAGIRVFKDALVHRRTEVLANYKLLHIVLTKYLDMLREQEEAGDVFRAPNFSKFMGNFKPYDISSIIITKQNSKAAKIRIAVATVDDQVIPESELANIPINQLIMYAFFVQERLEAMLGRRLYRAAYLQEYLEEQDLDINPRPWGYGVKRFNGNIKQKVGSQKQRKTR